MGEMMLRHFMMMWTTIDPIGNLAIFAALLSVELVMGGLGIGVWARVKH